MIADFVKQRVVMKFETCIGLLITAKNFIVAENPIANG
jgi:hypothetical protein